MSGPDRADVTPDALAAYYATPAVRDRIAEYAAGSLRLAAYGGRLRRHEADGGPVPLGGVALPQVLAEGADVCRSLEDAGGTLVHLDVDYVNADDPAEPYREPRATFARLEPVYRSVRGALAAAGVPAFELVTGRGYHFTARAPAGSALQRALRALGGPPGDGADAGRGAAEAAHTGAGRLMEHLAHGVIRSADCEVPVTLADVPPPGRGPFVCLDLSAYGDPVGARFIRTAFSAHQKALVSGFSGTAPVVFALPRGGAALEDVLQARGDAGAAAALASSSSSAIPEAASAPRWIRAYADDVLAWFHRRMDEAGRRPAGVIAEYARIPPERLPLCVRRALETPNPSLLVPANLRTVTLVLWSRGWHPADIAALVAARFRSGEGWGGLWQRYDPAARARFYVRLFAGAVAAGIDPPDSFTCCAQQARGACPGGLCGHELAGLFPGRDAFRALGVGP
jgi:hypothetical protein